MDLSGYVKQGSISRKGNWDSASISNVNLIWYCSFDGIKVVCGYWDLIRLLDFFSDKRKAFIGVEVRGGVFGKGLICGFIH